MPLPYEEQRLNLIINRMSKAKYEELLENDEINDNELYYITDDDGEQLVKGYAQEVIDETLLDYVKHQDIANLKEVEANPTLDPNAEEPPLLTRVKIGNSVFKVNEVEEVPMLNFSTSSAQELTPPPLRGGLRLLRSEPETNVYNLKTISVGNDIWNVETDLSDYSTTAEVSQEIQTEVQSIQTEIQNSSDLVNGRIDNVEEGFQYKIDDLKELCGQALDVRFDIEGYYYDTGLLDTSIIACYYRDPDYGNEADILYYYAYITDPVDGEAAILFTYI